MSPREYIKQEPMYNFIKNVFESDVEELDVFIEEEEDGFIQNGEEEDSEMFQVEPLSDDESVDSALLEEAIAEELAMYEDDYDDDTDDDDDDSDDDDDDADEQQQTETPTTTQPDLRISIIVCRRCLFPSNASSDEESE